MSHNKNLEELKNACDKDPERYPKIEAFCWEICTIKPDSEDAQYILYHEKCAESFYWSYGHTPSGRSGPPVGHLRATNGELHTRMNHLGLVEEEFDEKHGGNGYAKGDSLIITAIS